MERRRRHGGTKVDIQDIIGNEPNGYAPCRFEPYPMGSLRSEANEGHADATRKGSLDVAHAIERARTSIEAMTPVPSEADDPGELLLTEAYRYYGPVEHDVGSPITRDRHVDAGNGTTDRPSIDHGMTVENDVVMEEIDADAASPDSRTADPAEVGTTADYQPMAVLDEQGRPLRPSSPIGDRRDVYRLVMAHRRLDPRTSSEIVDAAGVGRMHANTMLNHGRPGNDLTLMAVARLYGIEPGFTAGRGVDPSHYAGMDPCEVMGPEVLSARDAGRRGSVAQRRSAAPRPASSPAAHDGTDDEASEDHGRIMDRRDVGAECPESDETLLERLMKAAGDLRRRFIEATLGEARANARAAEAEYLAKKAKAAAMAAEMRAAEAERLLEDARGALLQVRSLIEKDGN